jgi:hypothetical protein
MALWRPIFPPETRQRTKLMPSLYPLAPPTTILQEKRAILGMYVGNKRSKSWFPEYHVDPHVVWLQSASENVQKPNPRPRCESLENVNQQPNHHSQPKRRYAPVANHFTMLRTRQEKLEIRIPHGWLQNKYTHFEAPHEAAHTEVQSPALNSYLFNHHSTDCVQTEESAADSPSRGYKHAMCTKKSC